MIANNSTFSRTKNAIINMLIGGGLQVAYLICGFVCRTYFIQILGKYYLGINGLFTNILTILSFSELGISTAIIYNMYKPYQENDLCKVASLLELYKKAYMYIAGTIFLLGIMLLPFLQNFIKEKIDSIEELSVIFMLFVINTTSSYVLSYRKTLFTINQKDYYVNLIDKIISIIFMILQVYILNETKNFYFYLSAQIFATLSSNILIHFLAGECFPEILECQKSKLSNTEFKKIKNDIKSIFCYKVGAISLNSTSSILISKIISVALVGISSNYIMLINAVETVIAKAFSGVVSSIGNLNASKDIRKQKKVFEELCLIVNVIYGFCAIELVLTLNDLILVWIGNEYIMNDSPSVICLIMTFYVFGINLVASNFRTTMGFFQAVKFTPMVAALMNLILGITLGMEYGLFGIFIAILISRICTFCIIDPMIIYKSVFCESVKKYYVFQLEFFSITCLIGMINYYFLCDYHIKNLTDVIFKSLYVFFITMPLYYIILCNTRVWKNIELRFRK